MVDRRARRRRDRRVVAVRVLDGGDARARGLRRAAADDRDRVRDVRRRRARRRDRDVRRPRAARRRARRRARPRSPRPSRSRRRSARRGARGSCRRSAARCPSRGAACMPVPLAAGLYGILLGLGFTTFILSFAVWALAGIASRSATRRSASRSGSRFGAGRALPVIALAPLGGGRLHAAMAERPRILRSLRSLDALALARLRRRAVRGPRAGGRAASPRSASPTRASPGRRSRCTARAGPASCAARPASSRRSATIPRSAARGRPGSRAPSWSSPA